MKRMPRGAIPTPRNELAASKPYRPDPRVEVHVPSGHFPSPNNELSAALPFEGSAAFPRRYIAQPLKMASWSKGSLSDSSWAEEAFSKACAEPKTLIPPEVVLRTAQMCGASNLSQFMQAHGFHIEGKAYLAGPYYSVDWSNETSLHSAIAHAGPVKIIVGSGSDTQQPPDWLLQELLSFPGSVLCAGIFGYGPASFLTAKLQGEGFDVRQNHNGATGHCYAVFSAGLIGVIDREILVRLTGEAWVRNPTTIVKNIDG